MQFAKTLAQISASDGIPAYKGVMRHLSWQLRRIIGRFPVELPISQSVLIADRPTGVAALVNCMGAYDFNNMTLICRALLASNGNFFDVGANIGAYTLVASEVVGAKVVSIEPHPHSYQLLCCNVRRNARANVTAVNLALSDRSGALEMSDGDELSTNHVLFGPSATKSVTVRSITLDNLCEELKLWPTIIKIDVEGCEELVLSGYNGYEKTSLLLIENGERVSIRQKLNSVGYRGPLYFHAVTNSFSKQRQRRPEDAAYIRPCLLDALLPPRMLSVTV